MKVMEPGVSCPRQAELVQEVRRYLERLAELAHSESDALAQGHHGLWREIDKEIENVMGHKERAIGALNEHRKEHGC